MTKIEVEPDLDEIKAMSVKFIKVFQDSWVAENDQIEVKELARQMLTALAALAMTTNVIQKHAAELGLEIYCFLKDTEQASGGH